MAIILLCERFVVALGVLGAALILPLVGAVVFDVICRYLLGTPTVWGFEVASMVTGILWVWGAGYTLRAREHVRIDLLYSRLSPKNRAWIDLILFTVCALPSVALGVWCLGGFAIESFFSDERTGQSAWNPPLWPFRAGLALGFLGLFLQVLAEIGKSVMVIGQRSREEREIQ